MKFTEIFKSMRSPETDLAEYLCDLYGLPDYKGDWAKLKLGCTLTPNLLYAHTGPWYVNVQLMPIGTVASLSGVLAFRRAFDSDPLIKAYKQMDRDGERPMIGAFKCNGVRTFLGIVGLPANVAWDVQAGLNDGLMVRRSGGYTYIIGPLRGVVRTIDGLAGAYEEYDYIDD